MRRKKSGKRTQIPRSELVEVCPCDDGLVIWVGRVALYLDRDDAATLILEMLFAFDQPRNGRGQGRARKPTSSAN